MNLRTQQSLAAFLLGILLLAAQSTNVRADVRLPKIFGSNMVLQRDMAVPVWGWAAPGEAVTVSIAGQEVKTTADTSGQWRVKLAPLAAPGPYTLTITAKNSVTFTNVAVGEVWLCSGQSNMDFGMNQVIDSTNEIRQAKYPQVRLLDLFYKTSAKPETDLDVHWDVCQPETLGTGGFFNSGFTGVGYYFGRELHQELNVPIGLIKAAWGGTRIEPWTAPEGFALDPKFSDIVKRIQESTPRYKAAMKNTVPPMEKWLAQTRDRLAQDKDVPPPPAWPKHELDDSGQPTGIYNGLIHPLAGFAMRGVIWYQGESNRDDGLLYTDRMRALIGGWRKIWGQGDFPFYFVQLAPFRYGDHPDWLMVTWEAQARALSIPNTGMAVTTDLVENIADIHPRNKKDVGHRLALQALAQTYGRTNVIFSGPVFDSMKLKDGRAKLTFAHADGGLKSRDGKPLGWFEIAGDDGKFVAATASISGTNNIVVWNSKVKKPMDVRFGWNQEAMPNLVNGAGLPASPFRTGK